MGMPFLRGHVVKCQMSNWSNWNFRILVFIFYTNYHELTMNGWHGVIEFNVYWLLVMGY